MAETAIETAVQALIDYAVAKSLITEDDEICVRNYLMDMLKLENGWEISEDCIGMDIPE